MSHVPLEFVRVHKILSFFTRLKILIPAFCLVNGSTLYQRIIDDKEPVSAVTREMLNIKPRQASHYNAEALGENMPSSECFGNVDFGLLMYARKHAFEHRTQLNHAIVIVGSR